MKDLKVRGMRGDDIFPLLNILGKINITDEVVDMMQGSTLDLPEFPILDINIALKRESGDTLSKVEEKKYADFDKRYIEVADQRNNLIEQRGKENMKILLDKLLSNIQLVRSEVNLFLGSMCGLNETETSQLPIAQYTMILIKVFNQPELIEVFSSAAQLTDITMESMD